MIIYILRINTDINNYQKLNYLFNIQDIHENGFWELIISEESPYFNHAINFIVDELEKNKLSLNELNILIEDVSFWCLYEYESQCNMEFTADELRKLSVSNLSLCISCWSTNENIVM